MAEAAAPVPLISDSIDQESRIRNDLIRSMLLANLNHDTKNRQLKLIAIGEAGQGKSSLVNGLLGEELAAEGNSLEPGTTEIAKYTGSDGIALVWDTPGFGMDTEAKEQIIVEAMAKDCGEVDLILYCISMVSQRWPKNSDITTITMLTKAFGPKIWRYCQFVLTFANRVVVCSQEEDVEDPDQYFSEKVWEFEQQVRKALKEHGHLSEEDIQEIRVVAVGDPRPCRKNKSWRLPTTEDWFVDLWLAVSERIQQSALSTLIQLNKHRFDLHVDEDSINPPEPDAETHLRSLPCHAVHMHMDEHTKTPDMSMDCTETPILSLTNQVTVQATDDVQRRHSIPLYRIIYEQMKNDDSAFVNYVKLYWQQGGQKYMVFGHLLGLMRGIRLWVKCKSDHEIIDWEEEQDDDYTSSIGA